MTDVLPTKAEINAARTGIYIQLGTTRLAEQYGGVGRGALLRGLPFLL